MKCPHCGNEFDPVEGQQYCHFCGSGLSEKQAPNGQYWDNDHSDDEDLKIDLENGLSMPSFEYCPWEDQENLGFASGYYLTLRESLFNAEEFFSRMPRSNGFLLPLMYALIIQTLGLMFSIFWAFLTENPFLEQLDLTGYRSILAGLLIPVFVFLGIVVWAGILHISLIIVGGLNEDFEATFRVGCYSSGPELFNLIPLIGVFIAFFWKIYISIIGLREVHGTSTGKAAAAVLLPTFVCCGMSFVVTRMVAGMVFSTS